MTNATASSLLPDDREVGGVPSPQRDRPRVALAFPVGLAHLHRTLQGIKEYVRTHTTWTLVDNTEATDISIKSLRNWKGDGAIGVIFSQEDLEQARRLRFPFVSMSIAHQRQNIYYVRVDHVQIGRSAGEHLRSCGFEHFAYYGIRDTLYSDERLEGFQQAISPHTPDVLNTGSDTRASLTLLDISDELRDWLAVQPRPVGVFAANDARARAVADACGELGIKVPREVAIVGVDDNEVMCQFGFPTLTSIPCNRQLIGYKAAEVLDKLMRGIEVPDRDIVIPPEEIVCRESTDIGIFSNVYVTRAHRYIREHIHEAFGAEELARHLGITRRWLEQCIKEAAGRTPYEFICALRVEHSKQVLRDDSLSLQQVAVACGFRDGRHLREIFTKFTNQTPSAYRQQLSDPQNTAPFET